VQLVVVTGIIDETFYSVIWVDQEGELVSIDSRPSDAFALALRIDCPIFVEDAVLKASKANVPGDNTAGQEDKPWIENLNDEDFGKYKM
jgi:bifunctional DNase/RNase